MARISQHAGRADVEPENRRQILDAFATRAKRLGIRAIIIDDVARDLGVSKKTIYKHFRSKEELVEGLVERWHERLDTPIPEGDPVEIMRDWVIRWNDNHEHYAPAFWVELERDYPRLQAQYLEHVEAKKRLLGRAIRPLMKPGINPRFAWQCYSILMDGARRPEVQRAAGMGKQEALLAALQLWIDGALELPERDSGRPPSG